jgi:hypothetical protein
MLRRRLRVSVSAEGIGDGCGGDAAASSSAAILRRRRRLVEAAEPLRLAMHHHDMNASSTAITINKTTVIISESWRGAGCWNK